jgi:hypothetical protein
MRRRPPYSRPPGLRRSCQRRTHNPPTNPTTSTTSAEPDQERPELFERCGWLRRSWPAQRVRPSSAGSPATVPARCGSWVTMP